MSRSIFLVIVAATTAIPVFGSQGTGSLSAGQVHADSELLASGGRGDAVRARADLSRADAVVAEIIQEDVSGGR